MTLILFLALLLAAPHKQASPPAAPQPAQPAPPKTDPKPEKKPKADAPADAPADGDADEPEEWAAEYIEYRSMPELGTISVADGMVRGRKPVEYLRSHVKELAARNIFPCTDEKRRRTYRRTEEFADHRFDTVVTIVPPKDKDGDWTRHVTIRVDGRKKLDCSMGDSPDGDVTVYGITLFPEDGTIEVAAVNSDGEEIYPPKDFDQIAHPGVITDGNLQLDSGDDEDDMRGPLERA